MNRFIASLLTLSMLLTSCASPSPTTPSPSPTTTPDPLQTTWDDLSPFQMGTTAFDAFKAWVYP